MKAVKTLLAGVNLIADSSVAGRLWSPLAFPLRQESKTSEDYSGPPSNFNAVVGNHLNIVLHLRLMAKASGETAAGLN